MTNVANVVHVVADGRRDLLEVASQLLRRSTLLLEQDDLLVLTRVARVGRCVAPLISQVGEILEKGVAAVRRQRCHLLRECRLLAQEIARKATNLQN